MGTDDRLTLIDDVDQVQRFGHAPEPLPHADSDLPAVPQVGPAQVPEIDPGPLAGRIPADERCHDQRLPPLVPGMTPAAGERQRRFLCRDIGRGNFISERLAPGAQLAAPLGLERRRAGESQADGGESDRASIARRTASEPHEHLAHPTRARAVGSKSRSRSPVPNSKSVQTSTVVRPD